MVFPFIIGAFSAIASAIASIGPAVAGFCVNVLPKILPYIAKGMEVLKGVEIIANTVTQVAGIFKPNETAENIGDRALQAVGQGVTPDRFERHDDYMNALRSFQLNPEKTEAFPLDQKIMTGLAMAGRGLDERIGTPEGTVSNLWVLAAAKPDYFSADKLSQFLKTGQDIASIVDYFEGKLGGGESLEMENKLLELDKSMAPQQDENSIRAKIYATAEAVQNPEQ